MKCGIFGASILVVALFAGAASAQTKEAVQTREQVRVRILDRCVMTQSGKLAEEGAGPKCNCYAAKITKAMTNEEVAAFKKDVPKRLSEESNKTFATCR